MWKVKNKSSVDRFKRGRGKRRMDHSMIADNYNSRGLSVSSTVVVWSPEINANALICHQAPSTRNVEQKSWALLHANKSPVWAKRSWKRSVSNHGPSNKVSYATMGKWWQTVMEKNNQWTQQQLESVLEAEETMKLKKRQMWAFWWLCSKQPSPEVHQAMEEIVLSETFDLSQWNLNDQYNGTLHYLTENSKSIISQTIWKLLLCWFESSQRKYWLWTVAIIWIEQLFTSLVTLDMNK